MYKESVAQDFKARAPNSLAVVKFDLTIHNGPVISSTQKYAIRERENEKIRQ